MNQNNSRAENPPDDTIAEHDAERILSNQCATCANATGPNDLCGWLAPDGNGWCDSYNEKEENDMEHASIVNAIEAANCARCLHGPGLCERFEVRDGDDRCRWIATIEDVYAGIVRRQNEIVYLRNKSFALASRLRWQTVLYRSLLLLLVIIIGLLVGYSRAWEVLPWN